MGNGFACCGNPALGPNNIEENTLCCSKAPEQADTFDINSEQLIMPGTAQDIGVRSTSLRDIVLGDDADDSLGEALKELHEAVRLYREGDCVEAVELLVAATEKIEQSPTSKDKNELMQVKDNDPELKDLKELMASTFTQSFSSTSPRSSAARSSNRLSAGDDGCQALQSGGGSPGEDAEANGTEVRKETSTQSLQETAMACADKAQREERLSALEAGLAKVRQLCRAAQIFEAHAELERLEMDMSVAQRMIEESVDHKFAELVANLDRKLKVDPMLGKLRIMQERTAAAVDFLRSPCDNRGVHLETKDHRLGKDFLLRLNIRFAEGAEREKNGPSTQLIVRGDVLNFPAPLLQVITENCETDLFKKEWIKDCKHVQGKPGRAARLYCALLHVSLSPPLLPIKVEDVFLREFVNCPGEGLLKERGPGIMVIEYRAPDGAEEFEGMQIPPKKKGYHRVKGGLSVFYKTQSKLPGCTNIIAVSRLGLPVYQSLLPLSLLKNFAADLFMSSMRMTKEGLYDCWDQLPYKERIPDNPDFYGPVGELPADRVDLPN